MKKETVLAGEAGFSLFYTNSIVLATAVDKSGRADICTISNWTFTNANPIMYGMPFCNKDVDERIFKRYTLICIEETRDFVINVPDPNLAAAWDICGKVSLRRDPQADKFALANLTREPARLVQAPLIAECPLNIECRLVDVLHLPDHDWVVGEAVAVHRAFPHKDFPMPVAVVATSPVCPDRTRFSE